MTGPKQQKKKNPWDIVTDLHERDVEEILRELERDNADKPEKPDYPYEHDLDWN